MARRVLVVVAVMGWVAGVADADPTVLPDRGELRLVAHDIERPQCGGCTRASGIRIHVYRVELEPPAAWQFERFEVPEGRIERLAITPRGRHVRALLVASGKPGQYDLRAILRGGRAKEGVLAKDYDVYDTSTPLECEPSPCSTPDEPTDRESIEPRVPACADPRLALGGGLEAIAPRFEGAIMPPEIAVRVAPRKPFAAGATVTPEVECSFGQVLQLQPIVASAGAQVIGASFRILPLPADGSGRMRKGRHTCTVRFVVRDGAGAPRTTQGRLRFRLDDFGGVALVGTPRCPRVEQGRTSRTDPSRP